MDYEVPDELLAAVGRRPDLTEAVRAGNVGAVLRIFRRVKGLSQEEAGERFGYSAATLSRIESGNRPVAVDELRHLAQLYQIPPGMLGLASYTVLPSPSERLHDARRSQGRYAEGDSTRFLSAAMLDCPDYAADALGEPRGGKALRREQLAYHGDQPVRLSVTWVPALIAEQAPALLAGEPGELVAVGISGLIREATGRIAQRGEDRVEACSAWPAAAMHLRRKEGSPMLRTRTWWRDAIGVLQYAETVTAHPVRYIYDGDGQPER